MHPLLSDQIAHERRDDALARASASGRASRVDVVRPRRHSRGVLRHRLAVMLVAIAARLDRSLDRSTGAVVGS